MIPGEVFPVDGVIETLPHATRIRLEVTNTGDRPVQVGSHVHIAAGTAVRFEPGITRHITLVPLAGTRVVPGLATHGGLG